MTAEPLKSWEEAVDWLRSQPEQADLVRACYFDLPLLGAAQRFRDSREWRAVRQWLPLRPGSALDLGAGQGISTYALAVDGWYTTALEPDPSLTVGRGAIHEVARAAGLDVQVLSGLGEAIPSADGRFDLVYCRQVLHHASDLDTLCREVHRVLRPGGLLIATREHVVTGSWQVGSFQRKHPLHHLFGGENAFPLKTYLQSICGAGFELERVVHPLESEVNLAPMSEQDLRVLLLHRLGWIPGIERGLRSELGFQRIRWALSWLDHRAGRLYSFIARKR